MVSSMGTFSGMPNVAQVEENTKRFTPAATAASSRLMPPVTLLRKYLVGFSIDSPTRALAAKCMMASGFSAARAAPITAGSARSPW